MVLNSIQILTPCRHPNRALVFQAGGSSNHFAIRVPAGAVQSRARSSMGIGHGTARRVGLTCRRRPLRGGKGGHGPSSSPSPLGSVVPAATRTKRPGPHDTDGAGPAPQPHFEKTQGCRLIVNSSSIIGRAGGGSPDQAKPCLPFSSFNSFHGGGSRSGSPPCRLSQPYVRAQH